MALRVRQKIIWKALASIFQCRTPQVPFSFETIDIREGCDPVSKDYYIQNYRPEWLI
jgi:hypothetical protein